MRRKLRRKRSFLLRAWFSVVVFLFCVCGFFFFFFFFLGGGGGGGGEKGGERDKGVKREGNEREGDQPERRGQITSFISFKMWTEGSCLKRLECNKSTDLMNIALFVW